MNTSHSYNQWLEIDKTRFLENVEVLKNHLQTDIAAVVKGNGYGHGMQEATSLFYEAGIRNFCTYHAHSALKMKQLYADCRWIAMGPVRIDALSLYFEHEIELFVWELSFIEALVLAAQKSGKVARVHLELETGMYRTGMPIDDVAEKIKEWHANPYLKICGVCTHFSGADEKDNLQRIEEQLQEWKRAKDLLSPCLTKDVLWHGESSSASVYLKERAFSIARVGILLYGFFPSPLSQEMWPDSSNIPKPAIQLKARIIGSNHLPKGSYTGYGATFRAPSDISTVVLPVGYADGLARNLSHKWKIRMKENYYATIGRINMNMTVVNIRDYGLQYPEFATLIEQEGENGWYNASKLSGRFIYETLTCLPAALPRVIK